MSTVMTERRRPLENDDGQGALFGGEALAPAGPAPAWKRPGRDDASTGADAAPFEASVEVEAAAPRGSERRPSRRASRPTKPPRARLGQTRRPAALDPGATPSAFESGVDVAAHGAGVATPSPFADEIAELERATDDRAPRSPRAPLAGPTLDDVMSRAWEGLATGLPAACPVCHGEVVIAKVGPPRGRCSSCETTIE